MPQVKRTQEQGATFSVDEFAVQTLSKLAAELRVKNDTEAGVFEELSDALYAAVSAPDRAAMCDLVDRMLASGISSYEMADTYIPYVAQRLGEAWCADNIDFAVTTIGSARLQGLLRSLGPEWCAEDQCLSATAPRCLVVVPEGAQHTLGATILTGQLRRSGVSVSLHIGISESDLSDALKRTKFDAVMVSASSRESLDSIRLIIKKVRVISGNIPVVVGGNVLSLDDDILHLTGADFATSSAPEAIGLCGFNARMLRIVSRT